MAWQHVGRAPSVAVVQLLQQSLRVKVMPRYQTRSYAIETSNAEACDLQRGMVHTYTHVTNNYDLLIN